MVSKENYKKLKKAYERMLRVYMRVFGAPLPLPDGTKAVEDLKEARDLIDEILREEEKVSEVV